LTLKGSPQGLQAALQIEATITSTNEPDSLQYTKELFSFPIPDAGIEVRGIFKLGATLSYDVCVSSSFSGSATIDFGLQAGMPDSAQVTADIQNPDSSSATGWSGGSLTPLFDIKKESASVKLAAFSQPKLAFGIELVKVGNIDVALTVKLPEVSVTLTAAYDENGVCGAGSSKTGVKLDSEVNIEVGLQIDASIGDNNDTAKPSWSHALYAYPVPLGSRCFPFDIPGLNSSASVTSVPALPASTSTEASAPGASTITPGAQSGQSNHVIPVPSDLAPAPSNDFSITLTSAAATVATPPLVILSMTGSRTSASLSSVSDFGQPNAKAKAVVVHSHTSLTQSDTFSLPGLLGGDNVLDALNPLTTSLIPVPMTSASICSTPTALGGDGDGYQKAAPVHPKPTSTSTPKHSATLPPKPKVTPLPPPPTPLPPPQEDPIVEKHNEAPLDPAAGTSLSIKPAPVVTTTTSEPIPTAAITTPASGGGGCRMVKRFGKRMLIC